MMDLRLGDSREVLRSLVDASVDALVTDPPAGIGFMGKDWDDYRRSHNPADVGRDSVFGRASRVAPEIGRAREGFRGAMRPIFEECLRVLRPGAHGLVWALPRTSHWTATALEDAGFEIRDVGVHLFGTGFPKSLDVAKAIDKAARGFPQGGSDPTSINHGKYKGGCSDENASGRGFGAGPGQFMSEAGIKENRDLVPEAREWAGWGTALKPAAEHWILVRKPLAGTVAANVAEHGTGALNIDACRIPSGPDHAAKCASVVGLDSNRNGTAYGEWSGARTDSFNASGRWPANLTLDEEAAALLDAQSGELPAGVAVKRNGARGGRLFGGIGAFPPGTADVGDTGGASRFFYVAKPDRAERDIGCEGLPAASGGAATDRKDGSAGLNNPRTGAGRSGGARNIHPTVKPVDLMRWLCRLITPRGGLVLDPFMGSGTTGIACAREGFRFIGIEREEQYMEIARRRIIGDAPLLNRVTST